MASGGTNVSVTNFRVPQDAPAYFKDAYKDLGLQEWVVTNGNKVSNPVVERYIEKVCGSKMDAIKTPWCAFFVGAKLEYNGLKSTKSGMARSYLNYGTEVDEDDWRVGDIVILYRGRYDDGILGHIGFLCDWDNARIHILGGNQGDQVSIQSFSRTKILKVVRPRSGIMPSKIVKTAATGGGAEAAKPAVEMIPDQVKQVGDAASKVSEIKDHVSQLEVLGDLLSSWKPWIKAALTIISVSCIIAIIYFRLKDSNKGWI